MSEHDLSGNGVDLEAKAKALVEVGVEKLKAVDWETYGATAKETAHKAKTKIISTWKSGTKGKVIVITCAMVLLWAVDGLFGTDEADVEFNALSTKSFSSVFMSRDQGSENGVVYKHDSVPSVQVIDVGDEGVLVSYVRGTNPFTEGIENFIAAFGEGMDGVVFVQTDRADEYTNGTSLDDGYYLRDGVYSYVSVVDSKMTVPRFVELRDRGSIEKCHELESAREKRESEDAVRAEGESVDIKVPVTSLCGFVVGSTPSKSWKLFKENQNAPFRHKRNSVCHYEMKGTLLKPFRMFTQGCAEYTFVDNVPERLCTIKLHSEEMDYNKVDKSSCLSELDSVKKLLEDKYDIHFKKVQDEEEFVRYEWQWGKRAEPVAGPPQPLIHECESISLMLYQGAFRLELRCSAVEALCKREQETSKKRLDFSSSDGSDTL